jgi:hypothetical protein
VRRLAATPFGVCCLLGGVAVVASWFLPYARVEFELSTSAGARTVAAEWSFSSDLTLLSAAVIAAGLGLIAAALVIGLAGAWPTFVLASACAIVLSVVVVNTFANDPTDGVRCDSVSMPKVCAGTVLGSALEDLYEQKVEGRSEIDRSRGSYYDAEGRIAYLLLALTGLPFAVWAPYRLIRLRASQRSSALLVAAAGLAALVVAYVYMVAAAYA